MSYQCYNAQTRHPLIAEYCRSIPITRCTRLIITEEDRSFTVEDDSQPCYSRNCLYCHMPDYPCVTWDKEERFTVMTYDNSSTRIIWPNFGKCPTCDLEEDHWGACQWFTIYQRIHYGGRKISGLCFGWTANEGSGLCPKCEEEHIGPLDIKEITGPRFRSTLTIEND